MEDLVLTWDDDETGEEYAVTCKLSAQGLQVDVQTRRLGQTIKLNVPPDFAEDLAEWFKLADRRIQMDNNRRPL